jgi:hypothetical protein
MHERIRRQGRTITPPRRKAAARSVCRRGRRAPPKYDAPPDASEEFSPGRDHKRKLSFDDGVNEDAVVE